MKRVRKRNREWSRVAWITAAALLLPFVMNRLLYYREPLEEAFRSMAIASTAIHTPDSAISLLEERLRDAADLTEPPQASQDHPGGNTQQAETGHADETERQQDREPEDLPKQADARPAQPDIPAKYQAPLLSENFYLAGGNLISSGLARIRNETGLSDESLEADLQAGSLSLGLVSTDGPMVLILHTHATESFEKYDSDIYDSRNTWRSTDNHHNMVTVGRAMAETLQARGIAVLHDTTQHDYPSYNGSYERSAKTVRAYLSEYPSIKIVLDLHRDAMQRDNAIVKPVAVIAGQKAAQIMIISACDDGAMNIPRWRENLRFAVELQNYMEEIAPGLSRPVYLCYRKYNMDLSPGSLLLEFGSNANTLEEAVYSAELAGQALANLMQDYMDVSER